MDKGLAYTVVKLGASQFLSVELNQFLCETDSRADLISMENEDWFTVQAAVEIFLYGLPKPICKDIAVS